MARQMRLVQSVMDVLLRLLDGEWGVEEVLNTPEGSSQQSKLLGEREWGWWQRGRAGKVGRGWMKNEGKEGKDRKEEREGRKQTK